MDQKKQTPKKPYFVRKGLIPHWLKRELAVFGGMILESSKFIIVTIIVFSAVYSAVNGPAIWHNVKWWWYVNYVDDHSGKWWGIRFPDIGENADPDNTLFIPKIGVEAPIVYAESKKQTAKQLQFWRARIGRSGTLFYQRQPTRHLISFFCFFLIRNLFKYLNYSKIILT